MFQQTIGNIRLLLWLLISTVKTVPSEIVPHYQPRPSSHSRTITSYLYLSNRFLLKTRLEQADLYKYKASLV